jgi:hypothetical protein
MNRLTTRIGLGKRHIATLTLCAVILAVFAYSYWINFH